MSFHELTKKQERVINVHGFQVPKMIEALDKANREWLEEKVLEVDEHNIQYPHEPYLLVMKQIFGLSEQTLEEEFIDYFGEIGIVGLQERCKKLAEIAEEHFKKEE